MLVLAIATGDRQFVPRAHLTAKLVWHRTERWAVLRRVAYLTVRKLARRGSRLCCTMSREAYLGLGQQVLVL